MVMVSAFPPTVMSVPKMSLAVKVKKYVEPAVIEIGVEMSVVDVSGDGVSNGLTITVNGLPLIDSPIM